MDETKRDQPTMAISDEQTTEPVPVAGEEEHTNLPPKDANSNANASQTESPGLAASLQGFTDKALHFLAHASNETLGACLAGLGATTYLILGRVGLVIIGVAGGVVLHATWEGIRSDDRDDATKKVEQDRRKETGIEVAKRLLDLRDQAATDEGAKDKVFANQQLDFSRFEPETAAALDTFANAVIKDYVHYWYDPTLPGELSFPATCKRTLVAFLLSLSGHLERKRPADAFLDFVTNASSIIIVFLNELSAALNASPNAPAQDAINTYLELKPDCNLGHVLDRKHQDHKLNMVAEDILESYLDPKAYNCPPVHVFLKEVLAQLVLGATITLCSRPEWINEWIVYGLEESETTKEVMDIVDAGVEGRAPAKTPKEVQPTPAAEVQSKKERSSENTRPDIEHKRQVSRAEEAMDEAMQEAKRLTQMMIEEDQRRAAEEQAKSSALSSSEDISSASNTHGAPTPTSSQSDRDRQEAETAAWGEDTTAQLPQAMEPARPATPTSKQPFTSFDQMLPNQQPTALSGSLEKTRLEPPQLTLLNASINIFDDSMPGERASIKAKPTADYLIQIEPSNSAFPGWMIARKYADFEVLHEVLRRISVITGAKFTETHAELPKWKVHTKASLRTELERYLADAAQYPALAESEGMKRFLEKDQGQTKSPGERAKGFGWPTPEAFGKFGGNMIDVLAKAPKDVAGGVAGGGKAFFGGVAGLVGGKKPNQSQPSLSRTSTNLPRSPSRNSKVSFDQPFATDTYLGSMNTARQSQDSLRSFPNADPERKASTATTGSMDIRPKGLASPARPSSDLSRSSSYAPTLASPTTSQAQNSTAGGVEGTFDLPPPPSDIPDDYGSPSHTTRTSAETHRSSNLARSTTLSSEVGATPLTPPHSVNSRTAPATPATKPEVKRKPPINEQETSVAIELMFAVITELYTLSSAWNIRRTLLTAAKTYLLRPGNPQLGTIRDLLQTSMLDSNLSDAGIAAHLKKLRENALPTEEEMEIWKRDYPEKTEDEKEMLKHKARALLVNKGMPQALTSVMGSAASGEALGKVFDCLQVEEVSRGLIFGLMLQALKVVTH